jgi:hypothetical protein
MEHAKPKAPYKDRAENGTSLMLLPRPAKDEKREG